MPTTPKFVTLTNSATEVLNAIREDASINYRDYVPYVNEGDTDAIRHVGQIMLDYPTILNEFCNMINRIAQVLVVSKMYENPLQTLKKGMLTYGETVETVFVDIVKGKPYKNDVSAEELFEKNNPNIKVSFFVRNFRVLYPVTVSDVQVRAAFNSENGVISLIENIINSLYTSMHYDEFNVMKYVIARTIVKGQMYSTQVPDATPDTMREIASALKQTSNLFEFMGTKYNIAGVHNFVTKDKQVLLINAKADAMLDVNAYAYMFNWDKAVTNARKVLVDSFGILDTERLATLFGNDYEEISESDLEQLSKIPCILISEDFMQCYDNLLQMETVRNQGDLTQNYNLHKWGTYTVSPFENAVFFAPFDSSVTQIVITGIPKNMKVGESATAHASVTHTGFISQAVTWTSDNENVIISPTGLVNVKTGATGTIKITATSVADPSVKAEYTLTVA